MHRVHCTKIPTIFTDRHHGMLCFLNWHAYSRLMRCLYIDNRFKPWITHVQFIPCLLHTGCQSRLGNKHCLLTRKLCHFQMQTNTSYVCTFCWILPALAFWVQKQNWHSMLQTFLVSHNVTSPCYLWPDFRSLSSFLFFYFPTLLGAQPFSK